MRSRFAKTLVFLIDEKSLVNLSDISTLDMGLKLAFKETAHLPWAQQLALLNSCYVSFYDALRNNGLQVFWTATTHNMVAEFYSNSRDLELRRSDASNQIVNVWALHYSELQAGAAKQKKRKRAIPDATTFPLSRRRCLTPPDCRTRHGSISSASTPSTTPLASARTARAFLAALFLLSMLYKDINLVHNAAPSTGRSTTAPLKLDPLSLLSLYLVHRRGHPHRLLLRQNSHRCPLLSCRWTITTARPASRG